jgi:hypothetical protein
VSFPAPPSQLFTSIKGDPPAETAPIREKTIASTRQAGAGDLRMAAAESGVYALTSASTVRRCARVNLQPFNYEIHDTDLLRAGYVQRHFLEIVLFELNTMPGTA